jgi:hydrogenase nickel incorporation protein HypA/HybF
MHELSIAQNIIDTLRSQMEIHGLSRVDSVKLRVGTLRSLNIESLGFGFNVLISGSPLEGTRLDVEEVPIEGRCIQCGHPFPMQHWFDDCPVCGESQVEIVSGKELDIVGIEGV